MGNQTTKMKSLLVCFSVVTVALAAEEAPAAVLPALGYPYAFGGAYPYAYGHGALAPAAYTIPSPVQYKYVPKEVEIEVKTYQPELIETGCANILEPPFPVSKLVRPVRGVPPRRLPPPPLPPPYLWPMLVTSMLLVFPMLMPVFLTLMPVLVMLLILMLPMPSPSFKKSRCQLPSTRTLLRKFPFNLFAKTIWALLFLVFK